MFANLWILNCQSQILGDPQGTLCPSSVIRNGTFWYSTPQVTGGTATHWTLFNADVHDMLITYGKINQPRNPFINLVSSGTGSGSPGYIRQTATTIPFKNYNLTFNLGADLQSATGTLSGRTIKVGISDGVNPEVIYTYNLTASKVADTYNDFNWQSYSIDYVPSSTTTTVAFSGYTEQNTYGPTLDNVCFVQTPVPFIIDINTLDTE